MNTKRNYRLRIRAYDINEFIIDRNGNPEPLVDVIVPVRSRNIASARDRAIAKAKSVITSGWPKDEVALIGRWEASPVTPKDIKELSQ